MEKKNNGILIGIIIILVVALLGAVIYIAYDKGIIFNNDTDINDNKVNEETKEDVETEITNSLENFTSLLNSASLNNAYTNMYKNLTLTENEKINLTFNSLELKHKLTNVTIPNNQIKISADNTLIDYLEIKRQVSVKDVEDEYHLLFNEDMKTHGDVFGRCPTYFYDSTNSMYYLYSACGGTSDGSGPISYINKYTSKGNEAYAYVNVGYIKRQEDNTFNAYTNLDGTNLYNSNITFDSCSRNFIINEINYNEFSEYKLTFGKREDGSFYYKNIERIK